MTNIGRIVVALAFVAITFFSPLLARTAHRIDQAHFELIRVGMTTADVEAVFGVPPGNYDWAVHDEIAFFQPAIALIVRGSGRMVVPASLGPEEIGRTTHEAGPVVLMRDRLPWECEARTWVSRHGAYRIHFGAGGVVAYVSQLGGTRIEPPWRHWRQVVIGR